MHIDWFKFCALRNKLYDERKGNAGGNESNSCGSEEEKQLAKQLMAQALESLASDDAIQTVLASQLELYFSNYYFVGLIVDTG